MFQLDYYVRSENRELVDSFSQYGPRGVEQGQCEALPDYITQFDTCSSVAANVWNGGGLA